MATQQKIKPSDVLSLLKKGYTRLEKDNKGFGSIQSHYDLSGVGVKKLFQDSRLKNRKTITTGFTVGEDDDIPYSLVADVISRAEEELEAGGITDRGEYTDLKANEKDEVFA